MHAISSLATVSTEHNSIYPLFYIKYRLHSICTA